MCYIAALYVHLNCPSRYAYRCLSWPCVERSLTGPVADVLCAMHDFKSEVVMHAVQCIKMQGARYVMHRSGTCTLLRVPTL